MIDILQKTFDDALTLYSKDKHYAALLDAKNNYFDQTGVTHEEDEDYESRMNAFNQWYILQYRHPTWHQTAMTMFLEEKPEFEEVSQAFKNVIFSLFEYTGKSLTGLDVLVDILHKTKIKLAKGNEIPSIVKNDFFMGRMIPYQGDHYLMPGLSLLPSEVKSILSKESKKVRKYSHLEEEVKFLLQVESLRSKWKRYGHIDATKIFKFV